MKKCLGVFALVGTVALLISCGSTPPPQTSNYPEFYYNPPIQEDAIFGIGSAKLSNASLTLQAAQSRARQDLSFQLTTIAKAMITDYAREAGTAESSTSLSFVESIGQQLTQATLTGSHDVQRWTAPDGTVWILSSLSKTDAAKQVAAIIENEASLYAEFKGMNALDRMNEALSAAATKPTIVSE